MPEASSRLRSPGSRSVTRAGGDEDFVTAVFAKHDPSGWPELVIRGHPTLLRLTSDGDLTP
jgi:hypothetical protein